MQFSDRIGVTTPKSLVQLESMDDDLRNGLWNIFFIHVMDSVVSGHFSSEPTTWERYRVIRSLYFKDSIDDIPDRFEQIIPDLKDCFFHTWWNGYNLLQFAADRLFPNEFYRTKFTEAVNSVLTRELSGYRFINNTLVPISSAEEIASVEEAVSTPLPGVRAHMTSALNKLASRPEPDYANAFKEAISAVESLSRVLTGKPSATLSDALDVLDAQLPIHPALKKALSVLYGYASDEGGVRHALIDESKVTYDEAKFMVVSCSAFINYLVGLAAAHGFDLRGTS